MCKGKTPTSFLLSVRKGSYEQSDIVAMDAGISKLSLYDFLTMFLTGSLWIFVFLPSGFLKEVCCCNSIFSGNNFPICLLFFISAYLLGMIWNKIMECLCGLLSAQKKSLPKFTHVLSSFVRNNPELICEAEQRVLSMPDKKNVFTHSNNDKLRKYYFAYYYLLEKQALGNIPLLEAQVAFIRNLIMPLFTFFFVGLFGEYRLPHDILHPIVDSISAERFQFVAVGIIILIPVILTRLHYSIQMKIYELVWDGSHYISRLEEMRRLDINMIDPCICKPPQSASYNNVSECPFCRRCQCPFDN